MERPSLKRLVVGIDIGISMTKAVALENLRIIASGTVETGTASESAHLALEAILLAVHREPEDVVEIAVTGGGARFIDKEIHGLPILKVDEIKATGLGGLELSGKQRALVVNMGTGTSLVVVSDNGRTIDHIGGTGVGGGTIEGLGRRMLGKDRFKDLEDMAMKGDTNDIDMTVGDAVGGPVGMLPEDATASNFKKLSSSSDPNDVAAAIFNMVSQVVGVVAALAAQVHHLEEDVVFVGSVVQSHMITETLEEVSRLFHMKIDIPENGQYCTALGAAKSII